MIAVTQLASITNTTDLSSYSFTAQTLTANRLYIVFTSTSHGTLLAPSDSTVASTNVSFTEIGTAGGVVYSGSAPNQVRRIQAWRAMPTSTQTSQTVTITLTGNTPSTGMLATLLEFTGMDTTGTNGSGAIVQNPTNTATGATSITVTLVAFGNSNNRPVMFNSHRANQATTPKASPVYIELYDGNFATPAMGGECEWYDAGEDDTPSASWATASDAGGFALEIKAAAAETPVETDTARIVRVRLRQY